MRLLLALAAVATFGFAAIAPAGAELRIKPRPKPKPVRTALEARYAAIAEFWRTRTPDSVLAMRTPDFLAVQASGDTLDAAASARYTHLAFTQVETTLAVSFGLGEIDVRGDTAAVEIAQHWLRRQQKAGQSRLVDTRADQRETWVLRDGAWWLWRIDRVRPGARIIDGKRVDPSQPYDPAAPPFMGSSR